MPRRAVKLAGVAFARTSRFMNVAFPSLFRRLCVLAGAALLASGNARATDFTDLWWTPSEPGWGVNVVQSDAFMFLTFFIYGADNKPTWYTAQLTRDASGNFSGGLYASTGTYFAKPWSTADSTPPAPVGSAQFRPSGSNAYQATLAYVVDGAGSVVKEVERQTLTPITLGGTYVGGLAGALSGCSNAQPYSYTYDLQVSQSASGTATLQFAFTSPVFACSLSGALIQTGSLYRIDGAEYKCFQSGATVLSTSASIFELKATAQGIEGRWVASYSGCRDSAFFSAVLR